jgi:hypothetical protein
VSEAFTDQDSEAIDNIIECIVELTVGEAGCRQLWGCLTGVADVLEIEHVVAVCNGERHLHASPPETCHDFVFVARPAVLEEMFAVRRHPLDSTSILVLAELSTRPVPDVVHER